MTSAILAALRSYGADALPHAGGRTLLDHLLGTQAVLGRWGAPGRLQRAALIHSVYGTDAYGPRLIPRSDRARLAAAAGEDAERLAYLFAVTPRGPLLAGTRHWAPDLPLRDGADGADGANASPPTREDLDALVLLHMANIADQARSRDGSPGRWLARIAELAELLPDDSALGVPAFVRQLAGFSVADEALVARTYRDAVSRSEDVAGRASRFGLVAAMCPVLGEPCVWLAHAAATTADPAAARGWVAEARARLATVGTAWDKRLSYAEWDAILDALDAAPDAVAGDPAATADPRALYDATVTGAPARVRGSAADGEAGRRRFHEYVESLAVAGDAGGQVAYPGLSRRPWHDPATFDVTGYLESHFEAIRDELLGLDSTLFHRESERIARTGNWDVLFLYERGRRHDAACERCPVTMRGIDAHPVMRTAAGLVYVSRMRGGTHIAPHRGPTNLRLRCHLGLDVPAGDCAIRVGGETRAWEAGRCLVFDDVFEHEAWNHTEADRIVLIVDLWHPDLSPGEIALLEGLQNHTSAYARRLSRYWAANAAAGGGRRNISAA